MDPEIAFRLAVAGTLAVLPTLLFLGLWRGLALLRDDALVERVRTVHDVDPRPNPAELVPGLGGDDPGRCPACGRPLTPSSDACETCR